MGVKKVPLKPRPLKRLDTGQACPWARLRFEGLGKMCEVGVDREGCGDSSPVAGCCEGKGGTLHTRLEVSRAPLPQLIGVKWGSACGRGLGLGAGCSPSVRVMVLLLPLLLLVFMLLLLFLMMLLLMTLGLL